jgi:hypothetical protein
LNGILGLAFSGGQGEASPAGATRLGSCMACGHDARIFHVVVLAEGLLADGAGHADNPPPRRLDTAPASATVGCADTTERKDSCKFPKMQPQSRRQFSPMLMQHLLSAATSLLRNESSRLRGFTETTCKSLKIMGSRTRTHPHRPSLVILRSEHSEPPTVIQHCLQGCIQAFHRGGNSFCCPLLTTTRLKARALHWLILRDGPVGHAASGEDCSYLEISASIAVRLRKLAPTGLGFFSDRFHRLNVVGCTPASEQTLLIVRPTALARASSPAMMSCCSMRNAY